MSFYSDQLKELKKKDTKIDTDSMEIKTTQKFQGGRFHSPKLLALA